MCTDASALLSYGYWIARNEKNPSRVSCCDLCCVPCLYASERQTFLDNNINPASIEMTELENENNNDNKKDVVNDQPNTNLLLKL